MASNVMAYSSDEDIGEFLGFSETELEGINRRGEWDSDISVSEHSNSSESSGEEESGEEEDDDWSTTLADIDIPEFVEEVGATFLLDKEAEEAEFFHKIFPESLYEHLCEQTNLYALQLQVQKRQPDLKWKETTPDEIRVYIGLRIFMSVIDLPEIKMYWSQDKYFGNFSIADVMTRDRFEKISQYLHANDRTKYDREDPSRDKLYLIRPVLEIVNERCSVSYNPHKENAVDEAMVKFRGTLSFRQYMPAKPTKYGIKVWERADSKNGYVCEFEVYVGKPPGGQKETKLGPKVVERLTRKIQGKNHHIYFDNYFNSVQLHKNLLKNKIFGCGTVKSNAVLLPDQMRVTRKKKKQIKLQPGEFRIWQRGGLMASLWQEKKGRKPVRLLSSNSNPNAPQTSVRRKQKDGSLKEVPCPQPVVDYNANMAAVDRNDQMRTAYSCTRKSRRWWTYLLWFSVDLSISNAVVLMRESVNHQLRTASGREKVRTVLEFRKALALQLIGSERKGRKRARSINPDFRCDSHLPKKAEKRGRCKNCTKKGRNGYSQYVCVGCSNMDENKFTFLCVMKQDCFYDFHVAK